MDRQEFYIQLINKLTELGIDIDTAQKHVKKIDGFFAGLSEDEVSKRIVDLGDAGDFAESMYEIIKDKKSQAKEDIDNGEIKAEDSLNDLGTSETNVESDSENDIEEDIFEEYNADISKENEAERDAAYDIDELGASVTRRNAATLDDIFGKEIVSKENPSMNMPVSDSPRSMADSFTDETLIMDSSAFKKILSPEEEKRIKNNKILFWTSLVLTSPIWIVALLVVAVIFGVMFFAVGALTLACVLLMVGSVAAGTGIALFGIIYGITQLSVRPIGLYEIGLGIMIAGVTMIVGILLYNFIIRVMPIIYKYIIKFTKFTINKIIELFEYIKKECIGE